MQPTQPIHLTESPRDAQQGLPYVISPEKRAEFINTLLKVGFDVIDFGSFVSPRDIPQMAEQEKVLALLDKTGSKSLLMAIVGNLRGGSDAAKQPKLDIIGFPYSTSESFLLKNINSDNTKALKTIDGLYNLCSDTGKELHVFMSMAFGNPYGDNYDTSILIDSINMLSQKGIRVITLADTIGVASPEQINKLFSLLLPQFPEMQFGLHIHIQPDDWYAKIDAAFQAGCRSFDAVINGIGGCPMTGYELIGNLNTFDLLSYFAQNKIEHSLNKDALKLATLTAGTIYK